MDKATLPQEDFDITVTRIIVRGILVLVFLVASAITTCVSFGKHTEKNMFNHCIDNGGTSDNCSRAIRCATGDLLQDALMCNQ